MTAIAAEPLTLSALIRTVLTDTDLVTPDEVADEVAARTPDECLRDFYRAALRERVRAAMQSGAVQSMCISTDDETSPTGHAGSDTQTIPAGRGTKQKPVRSGKFSLINAAHLKRLRERLYVDGAWKMFGDLNANELATVADARDATAAAASAMAAKYRRVAKELENLGAETVRDLPPDVLDTALKG